MLIFWAVLGGFVLDAIFADPAWLPHPVVLMHLGTGKTPARRPAHNTAG